MDIRWQVLQNTIYRKYLGIAIKICNDFPSGFSYCQKSSLASDSVNTIEYGSFKTVFRSPFNKGT